MGLSVKLLNNMDNIEVTDMKHSQLAPFQSKSLEQFNAVGLPTKADEEWLYWQPSDYATALQQPIDVEDDLITTGEFVVIENGRLSSIIEQDGLDISVVRDVAEFKDCQFNTQLSSVSLLNSAYFSEMIVIKCTKPIEQPVTILNVSRFEQQQHSAVCKVLIVCEQDADVSITVHHDHDIDAASAVNCTFESIFKAHSRCNLHHVFQNNQGVGFFHSLMHLYHKAEVNHVTVVNQSLICRHDTEVFFYDEDAQLALKGVGLLRDQEQFFNHLKINHYAKNCNCSQHFKNILDDKAVAEFSGLVFVQQGSHGVDSTQLNNNLVFSDSARVLSRPQLQIDADDVQCAHGSTIGQLNPEEIHYVKSRGLSEAQARSLLIFGFIEEIIECIDDDKLKEQLISTVKAASGLFNTDG